MLEFWTKVVGEAKKEEAANLETKKRKRNKVNYTEAFKDAIGNAQSAEESAADIDSEDSSSDDDFLLPEDYLREPTKWGGTKKSSGKDGPVEVENDGKNAPPVQAQKSVISWERADVEVVVTHLLKYGYHDEYTLKVAQTNYVADLVPYPPQEVSSKSNFTSQ